jgi:hypothetical protein
LAAPGATLNDDIESIWMSKKGKVTYPSYSTTVPTSGTELYDYCIDNNLIDVSNHKSDMAGCTQKSALLCFDEKQKNIRYNIYLVGALISKLPFPLDHVAVMLIKVIYPNRFFLYLRQKLYQYYIENKIFKLPL